MSAEHRVSTNSSRSGSDAVPRSMPSRLQSRVRSSWGRYPGGIRGLERQWQASQMCSRFAPNQSEVDAGAWKTHTRVLLFCYGELQPIWHHPVRHFFYAGRQLLLEHPSLRRMTRPVDLGVVSIGVRIKMMSPGTPYKTADSADLVVGRRTYWVRLLKYAKTVRSLQPLK